MCRYCSKSRKVRPNGRRIEFMQRKRNKKTDWNNEETYHPIVRRRFAVQQLRRVHQIQSPLPRFPTASTGKKRPLYGEHRRFSGGYRRQPEPWLGRNGLARAFTDPTCRRLSGRGYRTIPTTSRHNSAWRKPKPPCCPQSLLSCPPLPLHRRAR